MEDIKKYIAIEVLKGGFKKHLRIKLSEDFMECPINGCGCECIHSESAPFYISEKECQVQDGVTATPMFCENKRHTFFMFMREHAGHTSFWAMEVPRAPAWGWGSWDDQIKDQQKASSSTHQETPPL